MIKMMDDPHELLDLVNGLDEPIDTIRRQEVLSLAKNHRGFVRGVGVFLLNSDGNLWIPRRGIHKKIKV